MELTVYTQDTLNQYINTRPKETKFGEKVATLPPYTSIYDALVETDVKYVIFGISESVGVWANFGNTGTERTWRHSLKYLLNTQSNSLLDAEKVLILGEITADKYQKKLNKLSHNKKKDLKKARKWVSEIDKIVNHTVSQIVKASKIPIIIGGGHNNAYGAIKGTSLALKKPINVVNFDAHTDFRAEEGRHSGNGFSYAYAEGFLNQYSILGIHENYLLENNIKALKKIKNIHYTTYDMLMRKDISFATALKNSLKHVGDSAFGVELDCDAIAGVIASAGTLSGFSVLQARQFITTMALQNNVKYLHLCEAIPENETGQQTGKLISYLITDFIKSHANTNSSI